MVSRVLVTGGAGYIGSHTCKALARAGFEPITFDNLTRGHRHAVRWGPLVVGDVNDRSKLRAAIETYRPEAVIHLAAHAHVEESVIDPQKYYLNNVGATLALLDVMQAAGIARIVFSSSAATYGVPEVNPVSETMVQRPINPYGRSKLVVELVLADYHAAYGLSYAALRYFNVCGADPTGEIGEWRRTDTHLIPRALLAAKGILPHLDLYGTDYPTPDGTCVRDYIHVTDLADAHVQTLRRLLDTPTQALRLNLGSGIGRSVRDVVGAIERFLGCPVPVFIRPRRPGDPPGVVADMSEARHQLGFTTSYSDIDTIVRTASRLVP